MFGSKPKLIEISSEKEAMKLLSETRDNREGIRVVKNVKFPDNMNFDYEWEEVTFKNCVMHGARFIPRLICKMVGCDLTGANLGGAYFTKGNMRLKDCVLDKTIGWWITHEDTDVWDHLNSKLAKSFPSRCPTKGSYTAYKKCVETEADRKKLEGKVRFVIVKLEIPADAQRSSAGGDWEEVKCRASKAKVLSIYGYLMNWKRVRLKEAVSIHDKDFVYKVGEVVKPRKKFEKNRFEECASGIHHFMTRQEAIDY